MSNNFKKSKFYKMHHLVIVVSSGTTIIAKNDADIDQLQKN
jgi:hypothetical protein